MATISEVMIDILDDLKGKDFKRFKWYMTEGKLKDIQSIPISKLENASVEDTVDLMKDQYTQDAGEVAEKILRTMGQNNLANQLKEKLSEVQSQAAEVERTQASGGPERPGGPKAPIAAGVQQTVNASETSKVQAPVMSGGQYNGPVTLNFT